MDVSATARSLNGVNIAPARAVARELVPSRGHWGLRGLRIDTNDAVQAVRDYNADFYRGRRNIDLDREAYDRFRNGLSNDLEQLIDQIAFVAEQYGGAQE